MYFSVDGTRIVPVEGLNTWFLRDTFTASLWALCFLPAFRVDHQELNCSIFLMLCWVHVFTATGLWALAKVSKAVVCFLLRAKLNFKAKSPAQLKDNDKVIQWHCNEMSDKPEGVLWVNYK